MSMIRKVVIKLILITAGTVGVEVEVDADMKDVVAGMAAILSSITVGRRDTYSGTIRHPKEEIEDFSGVDNKALCHHPRQNEPRMRKLPGGRVVKLYSECSGWGDHLMAEHPSEQVNVMED